MKQECLRVLRDLSTSKEQYRLAAEKLASILAIEASAYLKKDTVTVTTPLAKTTGECLDQPVVLVPILRSGLVMLFSFLQFYPEALVGLIGIAREESTALPHLYYTKLPSLPKECKVMILDPMLATGGTACMAIDELIKRGVLEHQLLLISCLAAPEGLAKVQERFPKVTTHIAMVDKGLDAQKRILPGIGDFGDRYFGTEAL